MSRKQRIDQPLFLERAHRVRILDFQGSRHLMATYEQKGQNSIAMFQIIRVESSH